MGHIDEGRPRSTGVLRFLPSPVSGLICASYGYPGAGDPLRQGFHGVSHGSPAGTEAILPGGALRQTPDDDDEDDLCRAWERFPCNPLPEFRAQWALWFVI